MLQKLVSNVECEMLVQALVDADRSPRGGEKSAKGDYLSPGRQVESSIDVKI